MINKTENKSSINCCCCCVCFIDWIDTEDIRSMINEQHRNRNARRHKNILVKDISPHRRGDEWCSSEFIDQIFSVWFDNDRRVAMKRNRSFPLPFRSFIVPLAASRLSFSLILPSTFCPKRSSNASNWQTCFFTDREINQDTHTHTRTIGRTVQKGRNQRKKRNTWLLMSRTYQYPCNRAPLMEMTMIFSQNGRRKWIGSGH